MLMASQKNRHITNFKLKDTNFIIKLAGFVRTLESAMVQHRSNQNSPILILKNIILIVNSF